MRISDWSSDVCSSDLFDIERVRLYPYLQQMRAVFRRRIEFRMAHAGTGAHALHIAGPYRAAVAHAVFVRNRSEEHTSELQSLMRISYAVFCLKTKRQYLYKQV